MSGRIRSIMMGVLVVGALALGASESYAGYRSFMGDCEDCQAIQYNWCAVHTMGGQEGCTDCCRACGFFDGFCHSFEETEFQGCECQGA